jgi:hypothetical protein
MLTRRHRKRYTGEGSLIKPTTLSVEAGQPQTCIGKLVDDVLLHYHPWSESDPGYWCTRATIVVVDGNRVAVLLGGWASPSSALGPAADNLAVLLDPAAPPEFELRLESVEPL